ncbi:MAG: hypothetical protein KKF46_07465 [Nanoarchaeota archaeon]|nr:hypothetical protein [Nanoarchaeota archaeon]MBU1322165.1 hypothetical protein [Nanoarchaeota archaeon]MBU1598083.1 hypothetical protein [Nanoarchaeota archaeon]MBU2441670.1 hypothetical protein [Nanoarchaeota archaeon]
METKIIIAEKKTISDAIAKAIAPELFDSEGRTDALHRDIIFVKPRGTHDITSCFVSKNNLKEDNYHYFCQYKCDNCNFEAVYVDKTSKQNPSRARKNLESMIEIEEEKEQGLKSEKKNPKQKPLVEDISYYLIEKDGVRYIIVDTSGNIYNLNNNSKTYLEKAVIEAKDFSDLESKLSFKPKIDKIKGKNNRSYQARSFLINSLLSAQRMPCDTPTIRKGSRIEIDEIIGATDFDIAGSSIFYSVIEAANAQRKNKRYEEIKIPLKRINPDDLSSATLKEQINNPQEIDWENVYSGKLKSFFDYIYGVSLTTKANYVKRQKVPESRLKFSIGRTLLLGLKEVLREEHRLSKENPEDYTYLIFDGLLDLETIQKKVAEPDYAMVQTKEYNNGISNSRFLEICREQNIGTHTTRAPLINRLIKNNLLETDGRTIKSTPFGNIYYNYIFQYLDNPEKDFSIAKWSNFLHYVIDNWRTDDKILSERISVTQKEMKEQFDLFMNEFLKSFQKHLKELRPQYNKIVNDLTRIYNAIPASPSKKAKQDQRTEIIEENENQIKGNVLELKGTTAYLRKENIEKIIDKNNVPLPNPINRINRILESKIVTIEIDELMLRRICNIPLGTEFYMEKSYNIENLALIKDGYHTVFKTKGKIKDFSQLDLKGYVPYELDESNFQKDNEITAHGSLFVDTINSSTIKGLEGYLLVKEYNLPWIITLDKKTKQREGKINVEALNVNDLMFNQVSRYKYGEVHNYESLLSAMKEKHGFSFEYTAKLAEQLYLSAEK